MDWLVILSWQGSIFFHSGSFDNTYERIFTAGAEGKQICIFSFWPLPSSIFTAENSPKAKKYFIETSSKLWGNSCPFQQLEYTFETKSECPLLLCRCVGVRVAPRVQSHSLIPTGVLPCATNVPASGCWYKTVSSVRVSYRYMKTNKKNKRLNCGKFSQNLT